MVASRTDSSNPARIPALGVRLIVLLFASIILMVLDHRQNHLSAVRQAIGAAVYPLQVIVDAPFRLWEWVRDSSADRNQLKLELSRLEAERLLTNARLQRMTALEAENARLRDLLDARAQVRDEVRVAEIMAVDANPYRHNIVIDIGAREGAYDGQSIVDVTGVIGQIIETGLTTSQAMLISDPESFSARRGQSQRLADDRQWHWRIRPAGSALRHQQRRHSARRSAGHLRFGRRIPGRLPGRRCGHGQPYSTGTLRGRKRDAGCGARPGA